MALNWYQCKKCGKTIKKYSTPVSLGCPVATVHKWSKLAEVGNTDYSCKKCGTVIQADSTPGSSGCPVAVYHQWALL